jgi:DNA-binding beta-propeller fold protein YncE
LSNHRVQKFTSNGIFVTKWTYENTGGEGASRQPHQLAVDSFGNVYLTDRANSEILVFDGNGKFLTRWGSKGTEEGEFIKPHGIVFNSKDQMYITDMGNSRVQEFYKNGTFIRMWGSLGQEEQGKFSDSIPGIAVDRLNNIYVIDRLQSVIQKFDGNGTFIKMWGSKGSTNGTMQKPEDLAINSITGDVYVTDTKNSRIQEFSEVR